MRLPQSRIDAIRGLHFFVALCRYSGSRMMMRGRALQRGQSGHWSSRWRQLQRKPPLGALRRARIQIQTQKSADSGIDSPCQFGCVNLQSGLATVCCTLRSCKEAPCSVVGRCSRRSLLQSGAPDASDPACADMSCCVVQHSLQLHEGCESLQDLRGGQGIPCRSHFVHQQTKVELGNPTNLERFGLHSDFL